MKSGAVVHDGLEIHYGDHGEGSPLLLLHGFTGSSDAMSALAELLAGAHRVVAVDLVGHGRSAAPSSIEQCSMAAVVEQVAAVATHLSFDRFHLVGYSMGGRVALSMAAASEEVSSVVAVGASAGILDDTARQQRAGSDAALARQIEERGIEWFVDYWSALPLLRPASAAGRAAAPWLREVRLRNEPAAMAMVLRGLGAGSMPPLHEVLARLDVPALFVAGDADAKYRALAGELAGVVPDGRSVVVPDAGHSVPIDNPRSLAGEVLAFLSEVDVRART